MKFYTAVDTSTKPKVEKVFSIVSFLLGVSLPMNNPLMNLILALTLLCVLWQRNQKSLSTLIRQPLVWLPATMFALLMCSAFIHPHPYGFEMLSKYKKLLYVLPLALFFSQTSSATDKFISGFLFSNGIILIISLAVGVSQISFNHFNPSNPTVFKLHITQNFFMALAVVFWISKSASGYGIKKLVYGVLVAFAIYDILFLVIGRTGYVALFVGLCTWILLSVNMKKRVLVSALGVCLVCMLSIVPNRALDRVTTGLTEIQNCLVHIDGNTYYSCETSMGQRTAFAQESLRLIKQAPWFGNGAGGFWYINPKTGYNVNNPHNQFLLETVQTGVVGLSLFLLWMIYSYREAFRQQLPVRNILVAIITCYMASHLFNSFILDSAEGHLFVIISAIIASKGLVKYDSDAARTREQNAN